MNIGTRVRIVGEYYPNEELRGKTGTVVDWDGHCAEVVMDSKYEKQGDNRWPFYVTELEVIE